MKTILTALKEAFSKDQIIINPHEHYLTDHSHYKTKKTQKPLCVIKVTTAAEVQTLLKLANHYKIPITTRGAGTGKAGGAIPDQNSIVLSMENMTQIIDVDIINRTVTVEPGVILINLKNEVQKQGLWYPVDPASLNTCTIGGNVACNAGGPSALKYGVTGDYVLGLQGIYGNGTPFQFGGKLYKDVAGYDMKRLLIGSEGTLGVITTITLKLLPLPKQERLVWYSFDSLDDGLNCLSTLLQNNNRPSAAEFMPRLCIKAIEKYHNTTVPFSDAPAHLLVAFDTEAGPDIDITPAFTATTKEDQEMLWSIRRDISPALSHISHGKFSEDITVPISKVAELIRGLQRLSDQSGYICLGYGHLGDGNVHVNVLNTKKNNTQWEKDKPKLAEKIIKLGIKLGGTLSGEHGIGLTKKVYMPLYFTDTDISIMKGIKKLCDPNRILNPSKIV
jgi:glycolate oxidase